MIVVNPNVQQELKIAVYNGAATADTYIGTLSDDSSSGFGGNDTLVGGAGADTFWFTSSSGSDVTNLSGLGF